MMIAQIRSRMAWRAACSRSYVVKTYTLNVVAGSTFYFLLQRSAGQYLRLGRCDLRGSHDMQRARRSAQVLQEQKYVVEPLCAPGRFVLQRAELAQRLAVENLKQTVERDARPEVLVPLLSVPRPAQRGRRELLIEHAAKPLVEHTALGSLEARLAPGPVALGLGRDVPAREARAKGNAGR